MYFLSLKKNNRLKLGNNFRTEFIVSRGIFILSAAAVNKTIDRILRRDFHVVNYDLYAPSENGF